MFIVFFHSAFISAWVTIFTGTKEKCEQYWPDIRDKNKQYGYMSITNINEVRKSSDLTERVLQVANLKLGKRYNIGNRNVIK